MNIQDVLNHFEGVKRSGSEWRCLCPCHSDKKPSLFIRQAENGKILFYCQAGCKTSDILAKVGLTYADDNRRSNTWYQRIEYGKKQQYGEGAHIVDIYDYKSAGGSYLYSKVRFSGGSINGKEVRYYQIDRVADSYKPGKPGNAPHVLYRLQELIRGLDAGYPVYIVEGEKDVETLRKKLHWTATTAGSASDWRSDFSRYFKGARVVILPDNDKPGQNLAEEIRKDLTGYAFEIKTVTVSKLEKGDVTDYLEKEGGTPESLKEMIDAEPHTVAPWLETIEKKNGGKQIKVKGDVLADFIAKHEQYLMVKRADDDEKRDIYFYDYDKGVYIRTSKTDVKAIIKKYIPVGFASDAMLNNIYGLILASGRNKCGYDDVDADERYINVRNGLIDIKGKEITLIPHNPDIKSTLQLNTDYIPGARDSPVFDKYVNDLCRDIDGNVDESRKAIIQEFFGLMLSNIPANKLKKFIILHSDVGNTGKSQLFNLITDFLGGDRVRNIPPDKMNRNFRFELAPLPYTRLIAVGDLPALTIEDSSTIKQLSGGDRITVEGKGRDSFGILFKGGMAFGCNKIPYFKDDQGTHIYERMVVIPCEHYIEPEDRDVNILDKMRREMPSILNWFLEGLVRLIKNDYHLTESKASADALNKYHEDSDTVYKFVHENYVVTGNPEDVIRKTVFYDSYCSWCLNESEESDSFLPISKKNITQRMAALKITAAKANLGSQRGVMVYRGIRAKTVKTDMSEFQPVTQMELKDIPLETAEDSQDGIGQ